MKSSGPPSFEVTYETIRQWGIQLGRQSLGICDHAGLGHTRDGLWMRCSSQSAASGCICGAPSDHEGEVLDCLVQSRRNKYAAIKLMRKLLKKQGFVPTTIVTDHLAAYAAAIE
jgi:putative transposase